MNKKNITLLIFILVFSMSCSLFGQIAPALPTAEATTQPATSEPVQPVPSTTVPEALPTQTQPAAPAKPTQPQKPAGGNPFSNLSDDEKACLLKEWGQDAYDAITSDARMPEPEENKAFGVCKVRLPGGNAGAQPGNPNAVVPTLTSDSPLEISGKYLMAFLSCDTQAQKCSDPRSHKIYLAQSDDGASWSLVPNWPAYSASVPDVIRRGQVIYVFTPGFVVRYHLDTGKFEGPLDVSIQGMTEYFVDPSVTLDENGRLVLFFLYGSKDGDPAGCKQTEQTCEKRIGSATEVEGSEGAQFTLDSGDRIKVTLSNTGSMRSASDPDIFYDGKEYVLYLSHGPSTSVWTSSELRGEYQVSPQLPNGMLTNASGGVASGYYDPQTGKIWTFAHVSKPGQPEIIRRAVHTDFSRPLAQGDWQVIISGASFEGFSADAGMASPGFAINEP